MRNFDFAVVNLICKKVLRLLGRRIFISQILLEKLFGGGFLTLIKFKAKVLKKVNMIKDFSRKFDLQKFRAKDFG